MRRDSLLAALHQQFGEVGIRNILDNIGNGSEITSEELINVMMSRLVPKSGSIWTHDILDLISKELEVLEPRLLRENVRVITKRDNNYPRALLGLRNPPPLLYMKGATDPLCSPSIGICGSRKASSKGLSWAQTFGALVANLKATEVSGYASGIDTEAHLGALKAGGKTVVVLAEGILNFRLKKCFHSIPLAAECMTIISEFPPMRPWHVSLAMKRNGTICALSNGLVVVEAGTSGGTLAAGKECLNQKKPLLVIEYGDASEMPGGNSQLIRAGGTPVRTARELKERLTTLKMVAENPPASVLAKQGSFALGEAPVPC